MLKSLRASLPIALLVLAACSAGPTAAPATATAPPVPTAAQVPSATPAPSATATALPTATPAPTEPPTPTATPDPYGDITIEGLRARAYGGGEITVVETLAVTGAFTRTLITYPSDGLTVRAFMNTPSGPGPFPVVIVCHGYIDPAIYQTLAYTTRYADALARAGFLVVHPDYRGNGLSEPGRNFFRTGYAIDVLNLIALLKDWPLADPHSIALFGHSMGGGISLRVITVSPDVKAALVYGSMSADENINFTKIAEWRGTTAELPELEVPAAAVARIAPVNYLQDVTAAVSIHHGDADATVPPAWSADLYARLVALGKDVEYFTYPGEPHTFTGTGERLLMQRAVEFFDRHLRP